MKTAPAPWKMRQHHNSDSFNLCANALRECFMRNGGTVSRSAFRHWCKRYGQNTSQVELYFRGVGMTVTHSKQRRSDGLGRRQSCDRFTWRLYDAEDA